MTKKKNVNIDGTIQNLLRQKPDEQAQKELAGLGIKSADRNNSSVVAAALFKKAAGGDTTAIKALLELTSEQHVRTDDDTDRLYEALEHD